MLFCDRMTQIVVVASTAAFFSACTSSHLLDKQTLSELSSGPPENLETVFFTKHFTWTTPKSLMVKEHRVIRVGSNRAAAPEAVSVHDGSATQLTHFEARLVYPDGTSELFGIDDLASVSLSNRTVIAEWRMKYVPFRNVLPPGTLIETVSVHNLQLAPLGATFSLAEAGLRAQNINCILTVPPRETLLYRVYNDSLAPTISTDPTGTTYSFHWDRYLKDSSPWPFKKENATPEVLASLALPSEHASGKPDSPWVSFGNWYLDLIESRLRQSKNLRSLAEEITTGLTGDLEKINAIFQYCQENIRYEQVYLTYGEFIPNEPDVILNRKYGDCKDYSLLIYLLARSIGLKPHLALCYRGRGVEVYPQIPASQFNHMIVHYESGGTDHWFDGTNRTGLPGITTIDLVNAAALVLERDNSRFLSVNESPLNRLEIKGVLVPAGPSLKGQISVTLTAQYAIEFFALDYFLNTAKMAEVLIQWLRQHLHPDLDVRTATWKRGSHHFEITVDVTVPNCLMAVGPSRFTSPSRVLPSLFPAEDPFKRPEDVHFFPSYGKVHVSLDILGLKDPTKETPRITLSYDLPVGLFSNTTRQQFLQRYESVYSDFTRKVHFIQEE